MEEGVVVVGEDEFVPIGIFYWIDYLEHIYN